MSARVDDPVLTRFRAALDEVYGTNIERVVLFGSRARDDARSDSDYDVAVFLKSLPNRWAELDAWPIWGAGSSTTRVRSSMRSLIRPRHTATLRP